MLHPVGTVTAFVQYKSSNIGAIEQLPDRDHDLIKRWALARAKQDLGEIYSRYGSWPGAQGNVILNGPQLVAEAEKEMTALGEEIYNSAMPIPVLLQ